MTGSVSTLVLVLVGFYYFFFFFKQKTAYEMRISDWSSDVCSSDLRLRREERWAAHGSIPRGATAGRRALPQALGHSCRRPKGRRPRPEGLGGRRERCERKGGHTTPAPDTLAVVIPLADGMLWKGDSTEKTNFAHL